MVFIVASIVVVSQAAIAFAIDFWVMGNYEEYCLNYDTYYGGITRNGNGKRAPKVTRENSLEW